MRTIVSGFLAAAAYWVVIAAFLAMSMPSQAEFESHIEAAMTAAPTQSTQSPLG
ncbi:MAG TPA: hypothetical protein VFS53_00905 [Gemmatimonadota bacterium]|nr:hypothetical protein [Gemmatimonadota bacterium]